MIGVGNPDRGDDAVGPEVVAHLEGRVPPGVRLATTSGSDPATVMELWRGASRAILVDAMVSGAPAGTVERFDAAAAPLPHNVRLVSTHALGAGLVVTELELEASFGLDFHFTLFDGAQSSLGPWQVG